jgi:hypothetical protein
LSQSVRWALLGEDGAVIKGAGQIQGLGNLARASIGGAILVPGFPPLFVAGKLDLIWAVDILGSGVEAGRVWGLEPGPLRRLWLIEGKGLGLGRELEDVEEIASRLSSKVKP